MASQSFNDIINANEPVLIDFYADWCGPCQAMSPELSKLSKLVDEKARILKVNVDQNPQAASALKVRGVPTLLVYKQGRLEWRASGYHTAEQLLQILKPLMDPTVTK